MSERAGRACKDASLSSAVSPAVTDLVDITQDFVERYLEELWDGVSVKVTSLEKFARGQSRETWSIDCKTSDATLPTALILRRDIPSRSIIPTSLKFEFEIYHRLQDTAVPVARTLIFEDRPDRLPDARPFFVRERVDGNWDVPDYFNPDPVFDPLRIELSKEMVRKLALIHTVDWRRAKFDEIMAVPASLETCALSGLDEHIGIYAGLGLGAQPILTEAGEWLADNAPKAPQIVLLKGTNGRGEEVFRGREIVALSDWEQASLGDPASDFARTQDFFDPIVRDGEEIWGLQSSLDYYRELTGIEVPLSSVAYYQIMSAVQNLVAIYHSAVAVVDKSDPLVRRTWLATERAYQLKRLLLGTIRGETIDPRMAFGDQPTEQ